MGLNLDQTLKLYSYICVNKVSTFRLICVRNHNGVLAKKSHIQSLDGWQVYVCILGSHQRH